MAGNSSLNTPDAGATIPDPLEFERLLRREMAIEPSREFLPRVRERVRTEARPARWNWRWLVPAGAAAAACAGVFTVNAMFTGRVPAPAVPRAPSLAMAQPIVPIEPPSVERVAPRSNRRHSSLGGARAAAAATVSTHAGVIVDERQRAALAMFIRIIRDGRVSGDSFAQTTPVSLDSIRERVKPVEAGPLTVSPIVVDGVLQGESR